MSAQLTAKRAVVRLDDFVAAILTGLAVRGYGTIDLRAESMYKAFEKAYGEFGRTAPANVELRFSIFLDELHESSPDVRHSLARAADRGLVSLGNPHYVKMHISLPPEEASEYLASFPGGAAIYEPAIEAFVSAL